MNEETKKYFITAVNIIKSSSSLLIAYFLLCVYENCFFFFPDTNILFAYTVIVLFSILQPIAYGRYIEIIKNEDHISYLNIFKKHWINYYSVVMLLVLASLPFVFIYNFIFIGESSDNVIYVVKIIIDIFSIYIFPLVFFLRKKISAITLGSKCILGNFSDSVILVLLVLLSFTITMSFKQFGSILWGTSEYTFFITGIILGFISIVIDLVVFTTAALILKEKLFDV